MQMLVEITFQKNPSLVLRLLASRDVNLSGHYLDNEYELYRIIIKQEDQQTVTQILNTLRQTYEVAPVHRYQYTVGVSGQISNLWNQGRDILRTYNLEDNTSAVILRDQ